MNRTAQQPSNPYGRRRFMILSGRTILGLGATGSVVALLSACSGSSDVDARAEGSPTAAGLAPQEVSSASGTVRVLSWEWYEVEDAPPAGVSAEWGYLTANEDTITNTEQQGSYDIVGIYQGQIDQLLAVDRVEPLDTGLLTNFDGINATFTESDVIRRSGAVYAVPFMWGYAYLVHDARQTTEPASFADLQSEDLRDRIALPDDPYAVITTFARLTDQPDPNRMTPEQFDAVVTAMQDFRPQVRTIYPYGEAAQLLGQQDVAVAFPEFGPTFVDARDAGADAQPTLLGAWSYVDCYMVVHGAENEAAAYAYINNSISEDVQRAVAANSLAFPVVDSAVDALPEPLQYDSADDILANAPLLPGPPVDDAEGFVPFPEWLSAWEQFKA